MDLKKIGLSMLMLAFILGIFITSPVQAAASQYTGGYLDGVAIDVGTIVGNSTKTVTDITDNDENTKIYINNLDGYKAAWHTFTSPIEITSVVVSSGSAMIMEFYDDKNNLLLTYNALNINGIQTLPSPVQDVSTVVLKSSAATYIKEWNVFGTPSAPPNATTITWLYGGDQIVNIEWATTGAKSYNVLRAFSSGGPFVPIAEHVVGTSYTDKDVKNGTAYFYVISAVNEAGESNNSPQKSIQPEATKYTGGLLDGLLINVGPNIDNSKEKVRTLTDNNRSTIEYLNRQRHAWYTFDTSKEISSFIVASKTDVILEFYDDKNNLLYSCKPTKNDEIESLPVPVKNVKTVFLKAPVDGVPVYQWNVFGNGEGSTVDTLQLTAAGENKMVVLKWNGANGATGFQIKKSSVPGGSYTAIATVTGSTYNYTDTAVSNGNTYYYVVTSLYGTIEKDTSNEASAMPKGDGTTPPGSGDKQSGTRAILNLTLNNGIQKEFDLSMAEVEAFITWYEDRAAGNGSVMFAFDKHNNNKGPYKSRKEYVFFDKIITFEVNGYDTDGTAVEMRTNLPTE
ncbi:fibronectin type III domain-containing protein [Paenibacillus sp.]|uniref:fibronectin type III domain-containing protein n=1 Tax=Paenibacillus sp. TaxID=58172 RepID=UPI00282ABDC9|nr:fibronectin type III domain-containing protein [Paenibacillus sp.]MDR0271611.1 fibronectin type III domain-containing protein [Paenibacillus sp.]